MVSTCSLVQDPRDQCVTSCWQTTCPVGLVACMTCKILGHTEDMQSCVILIGREAKFVCEMHDIAAMHARLQVIIDARELTPRPLKEKRARAKQSLIATAGDSGRESHMASHVARYTIVDDAGLGGAAVQPRTRDADAAVAAVLDAGENPGAARLSVALAADRVRRGDRAVPEPPVVPEFGGAITVEEERAASLGTLDRTFRSMQQPKYTRAKRKSLSDVFRTVGVQERRAGAIVEIYESGNPYSIRSGAQIRTAGLKFAHILEVELASHVPDTLNAFFCAPNHFYGHALTAESLETPALVATLMECADSADVKTISIRAALTQFVTEIRRGNEGLQTLFNVRCLSHRRAARVVQDTRRACNDSVRRGSPV